MPLPLYDAHNHLQDERLHSQLASIVQALGRENVRAFVVNGSSETDWPQVLDLAQRYPTVIPSLGYHPWYIHERSGQWLDNLKAHLAQVPSAVGEIGLDRWIKNHDLEKQAEVFSAQLRLAAERNLPISIHCLQAWGKLVEILEAEPRPQCGFVLHSFGGPQELIEPLTSLGAYFSLPGYFAHERKHRQRETFRKVPLDRLLIETDAPDQLLPASRVKYPLTDENGALINHPANIVAVYEFAAELLERPLQTLAFQVEANFKRVFGRLLKSTG